MVTRRQLIHTLAMPFVVSAFGRTLEGAASLQFGYAAITWGKDYMTAIDEVAAVGFRGIQLRTGDGLLDRFGDKPEALKALLAEKKLALPVFSSGDLSLEPEREQEMFDLHVSHAKFLHAAGGHYLQVIDVRPKGRPVVADDYRRAGRLLTELSKRVRDAGVTLVYHPHMNSTGEKPPELVAILEAADPRYVRVLFDVAHYQQGGGDPAGAIRDYREWIEVLHIKDVRPAASGGTSGSGGSGGYQWVELGRGRVDLKAVFAALDTVGFKGWAVVELDKVPDPGRTPRESAEMNRHYLSDVLHVM
jgi:inosose dehydratase